MFFLIFELLVVFIDFFTMLMRFAVKLCVDWWSREVKRTILDPFREKSILATGRPDDDDDDDDDDFDVDDYDAGDGWMGGCMDGWMDGALVRSDQNQIIGYLKLVTKRLTIRPFGASPTAKLISSTCRIDSKHSRGSNQASKIDL